MTKKNTNITIVEAQIKLPVSISKNNIINCDAIVIKDEKIENCDISSFVGENYIDFENCVFENNTIFEKIVANKIYFNN